MLTIHLPLHFWGLNIHELRNMHPPRKKKTQLYGICFSSHLIKNFPVIFNFPEGLVSQVTPPGLKMFRGMVNDCVMDILYYFSPIYGPEVSQYLFFCCLFVCLFFLPPSHLPTSSLSSITYQSSSLLSLYFLSLFLTNERSV